MPKGNVSIENGRTMKNKIKKTNTVPNTEHVRLKKSNTN